MATSPTQLTLRHLREQGWTTEVVEQHGLIHVGARGCWLWLASLDRNGYGRVPKKTYGEQWAHRLFYRELVCPIPDGLVIDHLCRTPSCVNPAHMEPVTRRENARRSPIIGQVYRARSSATHCIHGHERNDDNTYVAPGTGHTQCRICKIERQRIRRER